MRSAVVCCPCGGAFDLPELFFVVADPGGDGFERGAQGGHVFGEPGECGGVCCPLAVFLDDCPDRGVPVEGGAADAGSLGDGGEGDGLAGCGQFSAGL